ncbi:MAG: DMT family transporter [Chloroflexi bacterium]|nr:DMT family transporter [Chloroflexota bacterium]
MTSRIDWLLFLTLGFLWGSSYLFIKIGVEAGLPPFTLVTLRLLFGFLLLAVVAATMRLALPRAGRTYLHLVAIGVLSVALPFVLITWAEQSVDSTLAAVLNGAIPLFVIVIAAAVLPDEPMTPPRVAGLAVGFVGIIILVGFDPAVLTSTGIVPVAALMGSTISYAAGGVYARRFLPGERPMVLALGEVTAALLMVAPLALLFDGPAHFLPTGDALFAVVWLGLFGSGLAFLIFFRLLGRWDATRTSLVAYVIPVVGLALGALVLREHVDARMLLGTALIVGGIALVNLRRRRPSAVTVPVSVRD